MLCYKAEELFYDFLDVWMVELMAMAMAMTMTMADMCQIAANTSSTEAIGFSATPGSTLAATEVNTDFATAAADPSLGK